MEPALTEVLIKYQCWKQNNVQLFHSIDSLWKTCIVLVMYLITICIIPPPWWNFHSSTDRNRNLKPVIVTSYGDIHLWSAAILTLHSYILAPNSIFPACPPLFLVAHVSKVVALSGCVCQQSVIVPVNQACTQEAEPPCWTCCGVEGPGCFLTAVSLLPSSDVAAVSRRSALYLENRALPHLDIPDWCTAES